HTRSKRDWSSDVCSSDLSKITNVYKGEGGYVLAMTTNGYVDEIKLLVAVDNDGVVKGYTVRDIHDTYGLGLGVQDDLYFLVGLKIGRASCRERVESPQDD